MMMLNLLVDLNIFLCFTCLVVGCLIITIEGLIVIYDIFLLSSYIFMLISHCASINVSFTVVTSINLSKVCLVTLCGFILTIITSF